MSLTSQQEIPRIKTYSTKAKASLKRAGFEGSRRSRFHLSGHEHAGAAIAGRAVFKLHTTLEEQVRVLIRHYKLPESAEQIMTDMLAHTEPGVLLVAAMGAAIAMLQAEGMYTYVVA